MPSEHAWTVLRAYIGVQQAWTPALEPLSPGWLDYSGTLSQDPRSPAGLGMLAPFGELAFRECLLFYFDATHAFRVPFCPLTLGVVDRHEPLPGPVPLAGLGMIALLTDRHDPLPGPVPLVGLGMIAVLTDRHEPLPGPVPLVGLGMIAVLTDRHEPLPGPVPLVGLGMIAVLTDRHEPLPGPVPLVGLGVLAVLTEMFDRGALG